MEIESSLLAEAWDHDGLCIGNVYEAATDNKESDVSELSSNGGGGVPGPKKLTLALMLLLVKQSWDLFSSAHKPGQCMLLLCSWVGGAGRGA